MDALIDILKKFEQRSDSILYPAIGQPTLPNSIQLPEDLRLFYNLCGGGILFAGSVFPISIMSPPNFIRANQRIFSYFDQSTIDQTKEDISWNWFFLLEGENSQYITIDLDLSRHGWCYNSNWMLHPGNSYVVAWSFSELLENLMITEGKYEYWDDIKARINPHHQGKSNGNR